MGFENVESIFIDNKEVQSIVVKDSGGILFQKSNDITNLPIMTLTITGSSFSTYEYSSAPLRYNSGRVFVDWGDNTGLIEYTGGKLTHTYSNSDNYTVKIYGNITSLGSSCFRNCTGLTSITLSNSITSLGDYCFESCTGLTSITIPDSVTSLGHYCFYKCSGLTSINIPNSVTSLGENCFYKCTGLTSITIPNNVTNLKSHCFAHCTSLTSIVIPDSVTSLGEACFGACTSLTSINIPSNVTSLGGYCFNMCTGLTSIVIPDSVTSLGERCFDSSGLTSINIPDTVTSLGDYCFSRCTGLISIKLNWDTSTNIPTYNSNWITTNVNGYPLFYIPNGTTSLYTAKEYPLEELEEEIIYDEIELTTDKSILSYANNETCTLTAQLTYNNNPVNISGETIEFFNGLTSMGTAQTNSSGVATMTYSSSGVGDIVFSATKNSVSSNTVTVEDCLKYSPYTYSSNTILNYTLPSHFKIEYESLITTTSSNSCFIRVGESDSKALLTGKVGSGDSVWKVLVRTSSSGSGDITNSGGSISVSNDWQSNTITYDGTSYKFHDITVTNLNGVSLDKLVSFATWKSGTTSGQIRNIKIKPFESISLVASQGILSYADSDSTTLTATHSLGTGKTVNLYNASDDTLIGTMIDNEDGTYSYEYESQGIGDLTVYASDGNITSEDILIEDCQYYTDNLQKIKDTFINDTSVSGRTIYESHFTFSSDVEIEFKLKNIPNNWLVGFGSDGTSWNSKGVWFKIQNYNQNKASIMYIDTGGSARDVGITTDYGTSTVFTLKSENTHKIYWYLNSTVQAYRDTLTTMPLGLRVDIFDNQDYDVDYIKVKAL